MQRILATFIFNTAITYFVGFLLTSTTVWGDVRVSRIFGDSLVLQQNAKNTIWGWAEPTENITVTASLDALASTVGKIRPSFQPHTNQGSPDNDERVLRCS